MRIGAKELALLLVAIPVALGIAELTARWYYGAGWQIAPATAEHRFWRYDEQLGWAPVAGSRGRFSNPYAGYSGEVRFDALGIRVNDNPETVSNADYKTLLLLGDSTTAGLEVDNNQTYAAVLERLLWQQGCHYRVLNAGVRGYGTDQALWRYRQLVSRVDADFILYMYTGNDPVNNRTIKRSGRRYAKPVMVLDGDALSLRGWPAAKQALADYAYVHYPLSGVAGAAGGSLGDAEIREGQSWLNAPAVVALDQFLSQRLALFYPLHGLLEAWRERQSNRLAGNTGDNANADADHRLLSRLLSELQQTSTQMSGGRLLVTQHVVNRINHPSQPERAAQAADVRFFNIDDFFTRPHADYHWRGDFHWNQAGHQQAAEAIMARVGTQLCAPA